LESSCSHEPKSQLAEEEQEVLDEVSSPLPSERSDVTERGEEERLGGLLDIGTSAKGTPPSGKIQAVGQHFNGDEELGSEKSEILERSSVAKEVGLELETSGKTSLSERIYAENSAQALGRWRKVESDAKNPELYRQNVQRKVSST
jgi:hypothetical protein